MPILIYLLYCKQHMPASYICMYLTKKLQIYDHLSIDDTSGLLIMVWLLLKFCFFKGEFILLNKLALIVRPWFHYFSVLLSSSLRIICSSFPMLALVFSLGLCAATEYDQCELQLRKIKRHHMRKYTLKLYIFGNYIILAAKIPRKTTHIFKTHMHACTHTTMSFQL